MESIDFWSLDDEHFLVEGDYRTMSCDKEAFCTTDWTELFEQWDKLDQLPCSVRHSGSSSDAIFDGVKNSGNSLVSTTNVGNSALPTSLAPTPPRVLNASLLRQLLPPKRDQKPKLNNHLGKRPCPVPLSTPQYGTARSQASPAPKPSSLQGPLNLSSFGKTIIDHNEKAAHQSLPRGNATIDDCGGGTNRKVTRKRTFACLGDGAARGATRMMAVKESVGAGGGRGTQEVMTRVRSCAAKEKKECETVRRLKITALFCTLRAILPFAIPHNDRYILIDTTCHYIAFLQQQLERLNAKIHILKSIMEQEKRRGSKLRPNESDFESQNSPKSATKSQLELISDLAPYVTVFVSEGRTLYVAVSCYEESPGLFATILGTLEQRGLDVNSANRSQHEHGEVTVVYAFHATVQKSRPCCLDIEELKTDLFAKAASKL